VPIFLSLDYLSKCSIKFTPSRPANFQNAKILSSKSENFFGSIISPRLIGLGPKLWVQHPYFTRENHHSQTHLHLSVSHVENAKRFLTWSPVAPSPATIWLLCLQTSALASRVVNKPSICL